MFHNNGDLRIIVGSSNMTQSALCTNHEWNTRIVSTKNGQYAQDIENEFNYCGKALFAMTSIKTNTQIYITKVKQNEQSLAKSHGH